MIIGIIGVGFVGSNLQAVLLDKGAVVLTYDIDESKSNCSLEEMVSKADIIQICLPTPTDEYGIQDIASIFKTLELLNKYAGAINKKDLMIFLRSTVLPGTTTSLDIYSNLYIIFYPEFLSRATAKEDILHPKLTIIGIPTHVELQAVLKKLEDYFNLLNLNIHNHEEVIVTNYIISEITKYINNCFGAVKVAFFNEIHALCSKIGTTITSKCVVEYVLRQGWINPMHTSVPGPDGQLGFGGPCLPKDLLAFSTYLKNHKLPNGTIEGALETNKRVRKDNE